jgi:hypothetical protein
METASVEAFLGHTSNPLSDDQLRTAFAAALEEFIPATTIQETIDCIWSLEREPNIARLTHLLTRK